MWDDGRGIRGLGVVCKRLKGEGRRGTGLSNR